MKLRNALVLLIAILFTVFALQNTISMYGIAKHSSEEHLQSTAYFIGITLDQALNRVGIDEELFLDVIRTQPWEEIAFIALYDRGGKILLHSSKRLIGKSEADPIIRNTLDAARPHSSYRELRTGETVYFMDIPVHLKAFPSSPYLLRIALHTYPSQKEVFRARIHGFAALVFVLFLWGLVLAYIRYSGRIDEFQKRESEKRHLVTLGEMAAVLAHEIRSPLSAIKGFAQYIREKTSRDPSLAEGLSVIISESKSLERLTEDLLVFARTGEVRPENFSLQELIDEVEGLFTHSEKTITITKDLSLKNDMLHSDRGKLKHILMNILQNAFDSIKNQGIIEIKGSGNEARVTLSVKDSGMGMNPETLENSITAFYTTKAKGTGLGLAIVGNLLQALHGHFQIESESGQGTTVTLTFERTLT